MSTTLSMRQFGTALHGEPVAGAWDDDSSPNSNQMGSAHPVHQGVSDVTPYSSSTKDTISRTTAWRSHHGGSSLPQPYTARNAGSIFKFDA